MFTVNEFLFLLKTIKMTQMFYPSSKGLLFSPSGNYIGINECSYKCEMLY